MLSHLSQLTNEEKDLLIIAPNLVAALIAGADGEFSDDEIKKAAELIHIKTFSEKHEDLREIYQILDHDNAKEVLVDLMVSLPKDAKERNAYLTEMLKGLNAIFPKLRYEFTSKYYKSIRQIAHLIANVDGGFWGMGHIHYKEEELVDLPMIHKPEKQQEA